MGRLTKFLIPLITALALLILSARAVGLLRTAPALYIESRDFARQRVDPVLGVRMRAPAPRAPLLQREAAPSGDRLAYVEQATWGNVTGVRLMVQHGDALTEVATADIAIDFWWSPTGDQLVARSANSPRTTSLLHWDARTGARTTLIDNRSAVTVHAGPLAMAYSAEHDLYLLPWDGPPQHITDSVARGWIARWSPSGEYFAYIGGGERGMAHLVSTSGDTTFTGQFGAIEVAWSPSGERLAMTVAGVDEAHASLWDADAGLVQLPDGAGLPVRWSPMGERLVYADYDDTGAWFMLMSYLDDGPATPQKIYRVNLAHMRLTWSPDGEWLGFMDADTNGILQVFALHIDDGRLYQISKASDRSGPVRFGGWEGGE